MANHHGSEGLVYIGASGAVAEVNDFSFTESAEFADDTTLSDTNKSYNATAIKSWSGNINCFWDEADSDGQETAVVGASLTLNLYPEGNASGDVKYTGTALITEVGVSTTKGGVVERSFSFMGTGALTITAV